MIVPGCWKLFALSWMAAVLFAAPSRAACCRVVKIDAEVPTLDLRVCEPDAEGGCGSVLFSGPLALGASANVCSAAGVVVYEEWDPALAAFGPPTTAVCENGRTRSG